MQLTESEKKMLFWASFLALTAAGVGFVLRSLAGTQTWGAHFQITNDQVGLLFGAGLWPIAITMILFSLIVDKVGYKWSMMCAFALQAISAVLTIYAKSFSAMWIACFVAGLGHGIVEACINPLCAAIYRDKKSKWLNILHASWPAGIVIGGVVYLALFKDATSWAAVSGSFWFMLLPVLAYGVLFLICRRYPLDERVEANVPMRDMLKEFGALGAFVAITFLFYEAVGQSSTYLSFPAKDSAIMSSRLLSSLAVGAVGAVIFGLAIKSLGKVMFFVLCLIMIPLATAELATDGWIQALMRPTMGSYAGWALVFSACIMMGLRFFAGIPLKFMSPPGLLLLSSVFSIIGLFALSAADGALVWVAFIFYAVGQTFYWPTVLGFVAEQFPRGGAMTLNTVSAMGLLTVGIFGFPFLGAVQDSYTIKAIEKSQPALISEYRSTKATFKNEQGMDVPYIGHEALFGVPYETVKVDAVKKSLTDAKALEVLEADLSQVGRGTLRIAAILPLIMAIAFLLIIIYYRMQGGYKPVLLNPKADPDERAAAQAHVKHPAKGEDPDEHSPM